MFLGVLVDLFSKICFVLFIGFFVFLEYKIWENSRWGIENTVITSLLGCYFLYCFVSDWISGGEDDSIEGDVKNENNKN